MLVREVNTKDFSLLSQHTLFISFSPVERSIKKLQRVKDYLGILIVISTTSSDIGSYYFVIYRAVFIIICTFVYIQHIYNNDPGSAKTKFL